MDLEKIVLHGESETVEFKESLQLKDEIGESISSFSNSKGGTILIGISDKREIKGIQIGRKTVTDLAEYIKRNTDPQIFPEIKVCRIDNRKIISIKVTESNEKPVFFKSYAYKRVGDTNQRISSSEIRRLAKESRGKTYWDEQICEEATLEDINEEEVRWFLKEARRERNLNIPIDTSVNEVLMRLNASINGRPTNASILLFAKEPQNFFLQAEVRCVRFKGNEPVKPFIDMKIFKGNIIEQVDKSLDFILEHTPKAVWLAGKAQREEKYAYPPEAIREAIVNAVCHRDYNTPSNAQIRVFDDTIEVWNPGSLPDNWTVEKLKQKHESIPKNPLIANQFFLIKFIEKWGTGTNDMIKECLDWGLPEPEFEDTGTSIVVTFRKTKFTEEYLGKFELNERQLKSIEYLKEHNKMNRKTYCNLCGVEKTVAHKELSYMVKKKIIKMVGKGRTTHYILRT